MFSAERTFHAAIRTLAQIRLAHPALCNRSDYQVVYAKPGRFPFAYLRQGDGETVVVVINPADRPVEASLPADALPEGKHTLCTLWGVDGGLTQTEAGWKIALPGVSAGVYQLS